MVFSYSHLTVEPSTILASRIMRAHDNPSPPPQDLAHPGIHYVPGKDGQFPLPDVSVPPSPFRPINLLERLNQLSNPSLGPLSGPRTPTLGARPDISESGITTPRGFMSSKSFAPYIAPVPMRSTPHEDLASADTIPSLSTQRTVDELHPPSSQHVCEPADLVNDAVIDLPSQPVANYVNRR